MPSSKDAEYVEIPQGVLDLADGRIHCRPRKHRYDNPFDNFLSIVSETTNDRRTYTGTGIKIKAAMLFHNYFDVIGTVVIEIYNVYLSYESHRIDLKQSNWMEKFHGCPNFWAGFGMAIARVANNCPDFGEEDPDGSKFIELVKKFGIDPRQ